MRVMILFDLPAGTAAERKEYSRFRKFLIRNGFLMMQESVYTKIVLTPAAAAAVIRKVRFAAPEEGLVQALTVTGKQYAEMELIVGDTEKETIDSTERLVVL